MSNSKKYKLLIINTHPVGYHLPIYRYLSANPHLDVTVNFLLDVFAKGYTEAEEGWYISYDKDSLKGYNSKLLRNFSLKPGDSFFGVFNPQVVWPIMTGRYNYILLFGYNYATLPLVWLSSLISGTPLIFKGEADRHHLKLSRIDRIKKWVRSIFFSSIDGFAYSFERNAEFFKQHGVKNNQLFFAPCSADNAKMQELKSHVVPSSWRQRNNISEDTPIFLFCGRLIKRKGVEIAFSAFIKLQKKHSKVVFCIAGSGPLKDKLVQKIHSHNLSEKVILTGFVSFPELAEIFVETHALILPSISDPSPKIVNEVMNFGIPVIVSKNVGTAGDLIRHGENGYIIDILSAENIANAMENTLSPKIYKSLSKAAENTVQEWSPEATSTAIAEWIIHHGK
tara:strand:+ start:981 stop:2165 length:1185 start_codon:yes stop_codon:yes gene_type:complete